MSEGVCFSTLLPEESEGAALNYFARWPLAGAAPSLREAAQA
jgi:hypothetical protein